MNGTPPRGKALPQRPSQEAYRGGQGGYGGQNGYRNEVNADPRNYGATAQSGRKGGPPDPNGRIILEGYRDDILNGFEGPKPRYNPVSAPTDTIPAISEMGKGGTD